MSPLLPRSVDVSTDVNNSAIGYVRLMNFTPFAMMPTGPWVQMSIKAIVSSSLQAPCDDDCLWTQIYETPGHACKPDHHVRGMRVDVLMHPWSSSCRRKGGLLEGSPTSAVLQT